MEIGLREWLIVGAIIVILLIIVDGWRRMRAQSNSLKIDIDDKLSDLAEDSYNPELPLGTARVFIPKEKDKKSEKVNAAAKQKAEFVEVSRKQQPAKSNVSEIIEATEVITEDIEAAPIVEPPTAILPADPLPLATKKPVVNNTTLDSKAQADISPELTAGSLATEQAAARFDLAEELPSTGNQPATESVVQSDDSFSDENPQLGFSAISPVESIQQSFVSEENSSSAEPDAINVPDILKANHIKQAQVNNEPAQTGNAANTDRESGSAEPEVVFDAVDHSAFDDNLSVGITTNQRAAIDSPEDVVNNLLQTLAQTDTNSVSVPLQAQHQTDDIDRSETTDHAATEKELCRSRDLAPSERDSGPDKFEQLLAERDLDDLAQTEQPLEATDEVQANIAQTADEEIESLKARLKELSPDYLETEENAKIDEGREEGKEQYQSVSSEMADTADFTKDANINLPEHAKEAAQLSSVHSVNFDEPEIAPLYDEQVTQQLSPSVVEVDLPDESELVIGLSEVELQISQDLADVNDATQQSFPLPEHFNADSETAQLDAPLTTVIDDDVSLEDLDSQVSVRASELNLNHINDVMVDDFELTQQDQTSSEEQVTAQAAVFDEDADPLMAGFDESSASDKLVQQFERDLAVDQQSVANELDMPISEILKKNKISSAVSQHSEATEEADLIPDPLMEQASRPADVAEADSAHVEENQQQIADTATDDSANLGFSAVEQGYDDDPLMSGFDDLEQTHDTGADVVTIKAVEPESVTLQQESLFAVQEQAEPAKDSRKHLAGVNDPNSVLIVTVVAKDQYLNCAALRTVVEACGMEFGEMQIFHRFEDGLETGAVQFSMANAINPGTFAIDTMDQQSTPGVSFFMSMDEPLDPKNAFECMIATAETVAGHLNGDLLDDDRIVLRAQTKEHYRERVRMHEMNKLRRRAH